MLALKTLSARLREILQNTFREPHRVPSYKQQQWLGLWQVIFAQARK
jgi:ATP-dependent RNA helicase DHX29